MSLNMGENMVANGEHEKISIGRVLVSVSTPLFHLLQTADRVEQGGHKYFCIYGQARTNTPRASTGLAFDFRPSPVLLSNTNTSIRYFQCMICLCLHRVNKRKGE